MPYPTSCTGLSPSAAQLSRCFHSPSMYNSAVLLPRSRLATQSVWAAPRSLATTCGIIIYFLLLRVMRCFSSPRSPRIKTVSGLQPDGLPHSEIHGSMGICPYPRLIAAYHVLLRLREPQASAVRPSFLLYSLFNSSKKISLLLITHANAPKNAARTLSHRQIRTYNARSRFLLFRNNMSKIYTLP